MYVIMAFNVKDITKTKFKWAYVQVD